jgi:hypothetical protein
MKRTQERKNFPHISEGEGISGCRIFDGEDLRKSTLFHKEKMKILDFESE